MTHPEKYYEPRKTPTTQPVEITYAEATLVERYGELIATAVGLLALGFALGMIVFALVIRP